MKTASNGGPMIRKRQSVFSTKQVFLIPTVMGRFLVLNFPLKPRILTYAKESPRRPRNSCSALALNWKFARMNGELSLATSEKGIFTSTPSPGSASSIRIFTIRFFTPPACRPKVTIADDTAMLRSIDSWKNVVVKTPSLRGFIGYPDGDLISLKNVYFQTHTPAA